jgi:hypothetical protein
MLLSKVDRPVLLHVTLPETLVHSIGRRNTI